MYNEDDDFETVTLEDLLDDGRFDEADQILAAFAAEYPDDASLRGLRALCLAELGRHDDALIEARAAVSIDGELPFAHWTLGRLLCDRNQLNEAMTAAARAARLDPDDARNHGLIAQIHALRQDWTATLEAADAGLARDPDDEVCRNLRTLALRGTQDEGVWSEAIDELVYRYPASGWARAGRGWRYLETGDATAARQSFEQALALDPTSDWARDGLIESIKAQSRIYAAILRLFLWLDRLPPRTRWMYILGGIFMFRALRTITETNPSLAPATYPLMGAWILLIVVSWTSAPLSDFILSRTAEGRRLVRSDRLVAARLVVGLFVAAILTGFAAAVTGSDRFVAAALSLAVLVLPVAAVFQCPHGWPRMAMAVYASVAGAACVAAIAGPTAITWPATAVVVLMSILGTWVATFLSTRVVRTTR